MTKPNLRAILAEWPPVNVGDWSGVVAAPTVQSFSPVANRGGLWGSYLRQERLKSPRPFHRKRLRRMAGK